MKLTQNRDVLGMAAFARAQAGHAAGSEELAAKPFPSGHVGTQILDWICALPTRRCPETGFEEPWAGPAFDGSKLPRTRLLDNFGKADPPIGVAQDYLRHCDVTPTTAKDVR